jgi:hypothetical protein
MRRNLRLTVAMLIAVAFMVSGWATIAAATTECMDCHGPMQGMGDMGGKEKPSDDCMLKIMCSVMNAQLPLPMPTSAAIIYAAASYPTATAATYSSHQIAPPLSPPRFFA